MSAATFSTLARFYHIMRTPNKAAATYYKIYVTFIYPSILSGIEAKFEMRIA